MPPVYMGESQENGAYNSLGNGRSHQLKYHPQLKTDDGEVTRKSTVNEGEVVVHI